MFRFGEDCFGLKDFNFVTVSKYQPRNDEESQKIFEFPTSKTFRHCEASQKNYENF
jgi:hypothetical protein